MTIPEDDAAALDAHEPNAPNPDVQDEDEQALSRPQRRLLRRIYNGRVDPIMVDDKAFLTYKEASRFLLSLAPDERERVYGHMKAIGIER